MSRKNSADLNALARRVSETALQSLLRSERGTRVLDALSSPDHQRGLSFSELKSMLRSNPAQLTRALNALEEGGLVENFLERRDNVYSLYKITDLGLLTFAELRTFTAALQRRIIENSSAPEALAYRNPLTRVVWYGSLGPYLSVVAKHALPVTHDVRLIRKSWYADVVSGYKAARTVIGKGPSVHPRSGEVEPEFLRYEAMTP